MKISYCNIWEARRSTCNYFACQNSAADSCGAFLWTKTFFFYIHCSHQNALCVSFEVWNVECISALVNFLKVYLKIYFKPWCIHIHDNSPAASSFTALLACVLLVGELPPPNVNQQICSSLFNVRMSCSAWSFITINEKSLWTFGWTKVSIWRPYLEICKHCSHFWSFID